MKIIISTLLLTVLSHTYSNAAAGNMFVSCLSYIKHFAYCYSLHAVPAGAICNLPPETGPCNAFFIRYFHDSSDGKCKPFVYGGCGGNQNNFQSLHACQLSCGKSHVTCMHAKVQ